MNKNDIIPETGWIIPLGEQLRKTQRTDRDQQKRSEKAEKPLVQCEYPIDCNQSRIPVIA